MNAVPWLADKWTVSDDKLTWTFHINDKACFSNGTKLTGELAAASIQRTFEKAARAKSMFEYESIKGEGQNVIIKTKNRYRLCPVCLVTLCSLSLILKPLKTVIPQNKALSAPVLIQ